MGGEGNDITLLGKVDVASHGKDTLALVRPSMDWIGLDLLRRLVRHHRPLCG